MRPLSVQFYVEDVTVYMTVPRRRGRTKDESRLIHDVVTSSQTLHFRRHRWQAFPPAPIAVDVTVLLRSCIVPKRQTMSIRFLLHTIARTSDLIFFNSGALPYILHYITLHSPLAPYLSQIALTFDLHRSTRSSTNCAPKWPSVNLSVGDIWWQIAAEWL